MLPERSIHYPFSHAVNRDKIELWPSSIILYSMTYAYQCGQYSMTAYSNLNTLFFISPKNKLARNVLTFTKFLTNQIHKPYPVYIRCYDNRRRNINGNYIG